MSTHDLRDLLDEATREAPADALRPPLGSIHDRIRRRRHGRLAAIGSAALAGLVMIGVGALRPQPELSPPVDRGASANQNIAWQIGFADGNELIIYVTDQPPCTTIAGARTAVTRAGAATAVTLIGSPSNAHDCMQWEVPALQVTLDHDPVSLVDGATGREVPLYRRGHLPSVLAGKGSYSTSWGVAPDIGRGARFEMLIIMDDLTVAVRGRGIPTTPAAGKPLAVNGFAGTVIGGNGPCTFVWQAERVEYELSPQHAPFGSEEELVAALSRLTLG